MSEIIVLTREQYFADLRQVAKQAADQALAQFTASQGRPASVNKSRAAALLGKSKSTVTKMIDQGRIRTTTDGMSIPMTEIDRYLNA
ncbi:MAG: helix-turn-helix domain-containing protein [Bacteroidota bacterium]